MKNEKTYPFSVRKHAHSIEYYYNHLANTIADMESGEIPMDKARFDKLVDMYEGPARELYYMMFESRDGYTVQLTGKQIGLAKQIVFWATEQRAQHVIESGKLNNLQYCYD